MKDIKKALEEYKSLAELDDAASKKRRKEITVFLMENKAGHESELEQLMDEWLDEIEEDVEDIKQKALRQQVNNKAYKLIPWSYIAKEYFGKSAAWLSQRINGTPVRGQIYTLSNEQKETFNRAVREVGEYIGSFRLA